MTPSIGRLHGRLVDCDSHLMPTGEMYREFVPPSFAAGLTRFLQSRANAAAAEPDKMLTEPDPERVWTTKWWHALGANDAGDRLKAMDAMGLDRQVVFPTILLNLYRGEDAESVELGKRYCDFMLDWARESKGRLRPVILLNMHDRDRALAQAEYVLAAGAQVCQITAHTAPAGISPADEQWDPFWKLFADAGVPLLFHLGSHVGFFDPKLANTERLRPPRESPGGENAGPFHLMTMYMAAEAYLTAMVFGGVFERHPGLRFGVIEMGGRWVSGWVERMDAQLDYFAKPLAKNLSMRPSDYVRGNLRVTPFYREPVGEFIARDGLDDVYVFSTDYPHAEGGTDPIPFWHADLVRHGHSDDVIEKFFVRNGELILPAH